jgi:AraC-like DNA-binding protein
MSTECLLTRHVVQFVLSRVVWHPRIYGTEYGTGQKASASPQQLCSELEARQLVLGLWSSRTGLSSATISSHFSYGLSYFFH